MSRRPYHRPVASYSWWTRQPRYIRYMLREFSSAFIGAYILVIAVGLYRLMQGPAQYEAFITAATGPAGIAFGVVTFAFAFYHSFTWFEVTPKAMPIEFGGKRLPGSVIVAAHWIGFLIASGGLWWLAGGLI